MNQVFLKYTSILFIEFMQIISHRGASKHAPEKTLEAFTFAHRQGVYFIECDVAMS